jgi:hypothetical protein
VVPLTTSCALMLKFEWPLIEPENETCRLLSRHTFDVSEYVAAVQGDGLAPIEADGSLDRRALSPATPAPRTWAPRRWKCCA